MGSALNRTGDNMTTLTSKLRAGALGMALAGGVALWPAYACADERAEGSKQSDIGAVPGRAVGAGAGGPSGAVRGAAAGALLGARYHRQAQASAALAADLHHSEAERSRLSQNVAQLDGSLTQAQAHGAQLDQTLQQTDELAIDVSFRTDDDSINTRVMPPLLKLGALVAAMPQARVRIAGYADPRGSEVHNSELSLRRAEGVAAVLITAGGGPGGILLQAHRQSESTTAARGPHSPAVDPPATGRPGAPQIR